MTASLEESKKTYGEQLATLKELFQDWTEDDLLSVLAEFNGDIELIIGRISHGYVQPFSKVTKSHNKKTTKIPTANVNPVQPRKKRVPHHPPAPSQPRTIRKENNTHHHREKKKEVIAAPIASVDERKDDTWSTIANPSESHSEIEEEVKKEEKLEKLETSNPVANVALQFGSLGLEQPEPARNSIASQTPYYPPPESFYPFMYGGEMGRPMFYPPPPKDQKDSFPFSMPYYYPYFVPPGQFSSPLKETAAPPFSFLPQNATKSFKQQPQGSFYQPFPVQMPQMPFNYPPMGFPAKKNGE